MTSKHVTGVLLRYWIKGKAVIPNYTGRGANGESDLYLLTKSGYPEEIEIKVSIADFRREFKTKGFKHNGLNAEYREYQYYIFPRRYWFAVPDCIADQVEKELEGTIYGLIVVKHTPGSWREWEVTERKSAKVLSCSRKLEYKELIALLVCVTPRIAKSYPIPSTPKQVEP